MRFHDKLAKNFKVPTDKVGEKIMREYGAMFVAADLVVVPDEAVFKSETETAAWQKSVKVSTELIGGIRIQLQTAAMNRLKNAAREAEENDLTITPRGTDAARRTYAQTVELWASRVNPALDHWVGKKKLTESQARNLRNLPAFEQVPQIFEFESEGIFFSKDLSKTIMYSVAPPGTSQHLAMLALDIEEHKNSQTREIMARHCWYQTVISDLPHFTFLGIRENELSDYGLKKVIDAGRAFWIPDL